jgi:hypothetical protein
MQDFTGFPLFDRINIQSSEDFENLLNDLNEERANFIIQIALEKAYISSLYSLSEAEILSKSLRIRNKYHSSKSDNDTK